MAQLPTRPLTAPSMPGFEPTGPRIATCPLCHTAHSSLSQAAVDAGADWRCTRCSQRWDAGRLLVAAAYAASVIDREHVVAATAGPGGHLRLLQGGK
jgi:hypothetical protein